MSVQYQDLKGATDQRINFRAPRYKPAELFDNAGPLTFINGVDHHLLDISMSGIAALDKKNIHNIDIVGKDVPIRMLSENNALYEGKGTIVRFEQTKLGAKIALNFSEKALDLKQLASAYHDARFHRQISSLRPSSSQQIPKEYRLLCSDTLHWLRKNRAILSEFDKKVGTTPDGQEKVEEIINSIYTNMLVEWRKIVEQANEYTNQLMNSKSEKLEAKSLTESLLTPEMVIGPVWHRSFHKPLGYPGDFQIMDSVYSGRDQGTSIYAKILHRFGLDVLRLVVTRKKVMHDIISTEIDRAPLSRPFRLTNLACGSAQEIVDIVSGKPLDKEVKISLIDQDLGALSFAYDNTYPQVVKKQKAISLNLFHSSFTELMRGGALTDRLPKQDLIYSLGLFDYFKQPRARTLVETLYSRLAPSGLLVIGNLKPSPDNCRWAAEFICDWSMIYRNEDQMMDLASNMPEAETRVIQDASNQVYLLCIRKPASN